MTCLSTVKFSMRATVLRREANSKSGSAPGHWEQVYDPDTSQEVDVWVDADTDPVKPMTQFIVDCLVTANTANRADNATDYRQTRVIDTEYLTMRTPARNHLFTTDRVTNITTGGKIVYYDDSDPKLVPAIYNVIGSTPVIDPFGSVRENQVLLKKANSGG